MAPAEPTRIARFMPTLCISSTAIPAEGAPIPVDMASIFFPLYVPTMDLYSRLYAQGMTWSINLAIVSTRAGSPMIMAESVSMSLVSWVWGWGISFSSIIYPSFVPGYRIVMRPCGLA